MWNTDESNVPTIFYHESIANLCKTTEQVFTGIKIGRKYGNKYKEYEVPVVFTHKDVMISKLQQESTDRDIRNVLPRIGISLVDVKTTNLMGTQQVDQFIYYNKAMSNGRSKFMYTGVPVKMVFELTCIANKLHELFNIYEYIVPRFRKTIPAHVLDTDLQIKRDIHLSLKDESWELSRDIIEFGKNRIMSFTLELETMSYIYPPIEDQNVINSIIVDYINPGDHKIKHIIMDYGDDLSSFVIDRWDVDPEEADKDDPHSEILTRIDNPGTPEESRQIIEQTEHNR